MTTSKMLNKEKYKQVLLDSLSQLFIPLGIGYEELKTGMKQKTLEDWF